MSASEQQTSGSEYIPSHHDLNSLSPSSLSIKVMQAVDIF
jgi:hypothetical protein